MSVCRTGLLIALTLIGLSLSAADAVPGTVEVIVTDDAGQPIPNAAVIVYPARPDEIDPDATAEIAQEEYRFVPEYSIIPIGSKVTFPNRDRSRHHVYSFSPAKTFELRLYVGLPREPVLFDKPGIVAMGCNIHDWMFAYAYVPASRYHALTDADGRASIAIDDPQRIVVWHPQRADTPMDQDRIVDGHPTEPIEIDIEMNRQVSRPQRPDDPENSLLLYLEDDT